MNITLMAHDKKKELMVQFCTAYKSVLAKHTLSATATTGRLVAEATGLPINLYMAHRQGGHQQVDARIAYNEIDMVIMFTDPNREQRAHRNESGHGGNADPRPAARRSGLARADPQPPLIPTPLHELPLRPEGSPFSGLYKEGETCCTIRRKRWISSGSSG